MMDTRRQSLTELLSRANSLRPDSPAEEITSTVAAIREALAAGLDGSLDALRAYLSVAHRFDHFADVWNASQLLSEQAELDPLAKAGRAAAWMRLFPETARARPKLVLELLGEGGTGGISNAGLSGLLSGWLEWSIETYERTDEARALVGALLATYELARCWWPEDAWVEAAPAFAATFVSTAIRVAHLVRRTPGLEAAGVSRALAAALELQARLQEAVDLEPEADGAPGSVPGADEAEGRASEASAVGDEELRGLAAELNRTKRRIWVVGALKPKWEHLMGVAKTFGLEPSLFEHVDYHEVKQKPMIRRVNLVRDFGVLLGPVPHSANELGDYSSLATQLKVEAGVSVVELRKRSSSQELRITKTSFREGLLRLLSEGLLRDGT